VQKTHGQGEGPSPFSGTNSDLIAGSRIHDLCRATAAAAIAISPEMRTVHGILPNGGSGPAARAKS